MGGIKSKCWELPTSNVVAGIGAGLRQPSPGPSLSGAWNCATVSFDVPVAWTTANNGATIRLYGRIGQTRFLVYQTNLETLKANGGGVSVGSGTAARFVGIAIAASGIAVDAWEVDVLANSGTALTGGTVALYAWGDSSAPRWVSGQALNDSMPNPAPPSVGSHLLGWDAANGAWRRVIVSAQGILGAALVGPGTSALTSVASSVAAVTLLAANANRMGAMVVNDGANNLYLALGAGASLTNYTVKIAAGQYYEVPAPVYTGIITGIWDVATGSARLTETSP